MHRYLLLLGVVAVVTVHGQETEDAPVIITNPKDLDEPKNLVMTTTTDLSSLSCSAHNADTVEWKFKATQTDSFTEPLASSWNQVLAPRMGMELILELREKDRFNRWLLNGYYQCVAGNRFGYKAITPLIRILYPSTRSITVSRGNAGFLGEAFRLPCYSGNGSLQINPPDYFDLLPSTVRYSWLKHVPPGIINPPPDELIISDDRIRIDPKTGDLFFKFLNSGDAAVARNYKEYRCYLGFTEGQYSYLIGIHTLTVSYAPPADRITLLYPKTAAERSVTCREGVTCYLPCLYGGRLNGQPLGNGTLTPPGKVVETNTTSTGLFISNPSSDAAGRWSCSLDSNGSVEIAEINVTVLTYPGITPNSMVSQAVSAGSEVKFNCSALTAAPVTTKFYINGNEATAETAGVTVSNTSIVFKNVQRNDSSSISCVMSNDVGSTFKTTTLVVYDKPYISGQPVSGYSVPEYVTQEEYTFNCSVKLDSKALNPKTYWKITAVGLANKNITKDLTHYGVTRRMLQFYQNTLTNNLWIKYDSTTKETFRDSKLWCECAFDIAVGGGKLKTFIVTSNRIDFEILANPSQTAFTSWWMIGVIAAVILFILIIILIIWCLRRTRAGGQCYGKDIRNREQKHKDEENNYANSITVLPAVSLTYPPEPYEYEDIHLDEQYESPQVVFNTNPYTSYA